MGIAKENRMGLHRGFWAASAALFVSLAFALTASTALANSEAIIADSPVPPNGEPTETSGWQAA
jgi:hypothetical protein